MASSTEDQYISTQLAIGKPILRITEAEYKIIKAVREFLENNNFDHQKWPDEDIYNVLKMSRMEPYTAGVHIMDSKQEPEQWTQVQTKKQKQKIKSEANSLELKKQTKPDTFNGKGPKHNQRSSNRSGNLTNKVQSNRSSAPKKQNGVPSETSQHRRPNPRSNEQRKRSPNQGSGNQRKDRTDTASEWGPSNQSPKVVGNNDWVTTPSVNDDDRGTVPTSTKEKDTFMWGSSNVKTSEKLNENITEPFQNLSVNTKTEKEESQQPRVVLPQLHEDESKPRVVLPSLSSNDEIDVQFGGKIVIAESEKKEEPVIKPPPTVSTQPQPQQPQPQPQPNPYNQPQPSTQPPPQPPHHQPMNPNEMNPNHYSKIVPSSHFPFVPFPPYGFEDQKYFSYPTYYSPSSFEYVNNTGNNDYSRGNEHVNNPPNRMPNYQEKQQNGTGYMNPSSLGPTNNTPYPPYNMYYSPFPQNYGQTHQYMRYQPNYSEGMGPNQYQDPNQH